MSDQPKKIPTCINPTAMAALTERVRKYLDWETLETRNSNRLDFHDTSVDAILHIIVMAFEAGYCEGHDDGFEKGWQDHIDADRADADAD